MQLNVEAEFDVDDIFESMSESEKSEMSDLLKVDYSNATSLSEDFKRLLIDLDIAISMNKEDKLIEFAKELYKLKESEDLIINNL